MKSPKLVVSSLLGVLVAATALVALTSTLRAQCGGCGDKKTCPSPTPSPSPAK